ncbi:MAG: ATP phosphoribosyltransferase [Dehalococcoidia bacterium]|nr:ATP phosphoribosyltransferase [Dehalococcoidia bacterium]
MGDNLPWIALPDGHLQIETRDLLDRAGWPLYRGVRKKAASFSVKVIRPQDMPLQVACGNFDAAITGKDWVLDQLYRFPSSPIQEVLDLGLGKVRVVAVVTNETPANTIEEFRAMVQSGHFPRVRVAAEYVNIADRYASDHHLVGYRVIPTWGATEAFLPEDADLLIENTQTGATLAKNKLKIIDTLFESTARLIVNTESLADPAKREAIEALKRALEPVVNAGRV